MARTTLLHKVVFCSLVGIVGFAAQSQAAVIYTVPGSSYTQNFNTLPNTPVDATLGNSPIGWINDTTTPGASQFSILGWNLWYPLATTEGGADGHQRMRVGAGAQNTGAFMSYGSAASTERALGMISSGTLAATGGESYYGVRITNNTGTTLTDFSLSYTGEQWRDGGATSPAVSVAQPVTFDYSLNATTIQDTLATYTDVASLGFNSPQFGVSTAAAKDGNLAANRVAVSNSVSGLNWLPGTDIWLRWTDINDAGNDHGLAIDDVSFSATSVPEPTSAALIVAGAGLLASRRRRA